VTVGGRAQARAQLLRRVGLIAAALVVLTLVLLLTSHWILGIIAGALSVGAVWGYFQARSVR
jgi:hypothetical protein